MADAAAMSATEPALREVPYHRGLPGVGSLLELQRDRLGFLRRLLDTYGTAVRFRLGAYRAFALTDPAYARAILIEQVARFEKGPVLRRFSRPFLGEGLVTCLQAEHRRKRRVVAEGFTPRALRRWVPHIEAIADDHLGRWAGRGTVELYPEILRLTMRVIGRLLFSLDFEREGAVLYDALNAGMHDVSARIRNPLRPPLWVPTGANRATRRALADLDRVLAGLIADRRAHPTGADDVLGLLLRAGAEAEPPLSDREIRDELATMVMAGFETTANALCWTLCFLAEQPAQLAAVRDELQAELPAGVTGLDAAALDRLTRLGQVIEESMRLRPPIHTLGRVATADCVVHDVAIRRGDIVLVCPYLMHRRADLYPEPDLFRPERFTPAARKARPRLAYIPFGVGPRGCIGGALATLEAKIITRAVVQRFDLRLPDGMPAPETLVSIRPLGEVPVQLIPRSATTPEPEESTR